MDQSTQVDFPIVVRKINRQLTVADLNSHRQLNSLNPNFKTIQYRPRSLNLSNDLMNTTTTTTSIRPKFIVCSDSQLTRLPILNDLPPPQPPPLQQKPPSLSTLSISRERTPPFSCNSSITSNGTIPTFYKSNPPKDDRLKPKCCCRCRFDNNDNNNTSDKNNNSNDNNNGYCCCYCTKYQPNGTKNLSWRRLHMSRAKLKATSTTSELLSGFAMIAMVELQINDPTSVPEWLFITFAVCTTILVAIHIFALMISTYILPNIDAIAKLDICEMVIESPHERMRGFIELAWAFSTVLGLFLFLVEVAILCWVKFWDYSFKAATAATIIVIPVLIIFILFAIHFYHSLVVYKCDKSISDMEQLEKMKKQLDEVTSPV